MSELHKWFTKFKGDIVVTGTKGPPKSLTTKSVDWWNWVFDHFPGTREWRAGTGEQPFYIPQHVYSMTYYGDAGNKAKMGL